MKKNQYCVNEKNAKEMATIPHCVIHKTPKGNFMIYHRDRFLLLDRNYKSYSTMQLQRWGLSERRDFIKVWREIVKQKRFRYLSKKENIFYGEIISNLIDLQIYEKYSKTYRKVLTPEKNLLICFKGIFLWGTTDFSTMTHEQEEVQRNLTSLGAYNGFWELCCSLSESCSLSEEEKYQAEMYLREENRKVA